MATLAEHLIERLQPWGAEGLPGGLTTSVELETSPELTTAGVGAGSDLAIWVTALAAMFEPALQLAQEEGSDGTAGYVPAWGRIMDPSKAPPKALPWLAQFVGVEIPKVASEGEARQLVKNESGLARGTFESVEAACRKILGTAPFTIQERTSVGGGAEPYHFNVLVGIGKSSTALKEAIEAVKPGGLQFAILEVKDAWIAGTKAWSAVAGGLKWSSPPHEGEY